MTLQLETGPGTRLSLPIRSSGTEADPIDPFGLPEAAEAPPVRVLSAGTWRRRYSFEVGTGKHEVVWGLDRPAEFCLPESGLGLAQTAEDRFSIVDGDPLSATVQCVWSITIRRAEWEVRVVAESTMTSDASFFHIHSALQGDRSEPSVHEGLDFPHPA